MRHNAILCFAGPPGTDDLRVFDAWAARELPLTLCAQMENAMGHDSAPIVGSIESVTPPSGDGPVLGVIDIADDTTDGQLAESHVSAGRLLGISVDYIPDPTQIAWECVSTDADGWCTAEVTHYGGVTTIGAATLVGIPAFSGALVDPTPLDAATDVPAPEPIVAGAGSTTLQRALPRVRPTVAEMPDSEGGHLVASLAQRGGVDLLEPPAEWFADPRLPTYTQLTVTDDGRVFGHVAPWTGCHIGFTDRCVPPPHSSAGYLHFRQSSNGRRVRNADGSTAAIRTGALTIGAEHAPVRGVGSSYEAAVDHYAHSALSWADVMAGEDQHGPWVAGAIRPNVTQEQLVTIRALAPSGDWRRYPPPNGQHELVAVLMVNTPGFRDVGDHAMAAGAQIVDHSDDALIIVTPRGPITAACTECDEEHFVGVDARILAIVAELEPLARERALARLRA